MEREGQDRRTEREGEREREGGNTAQALSLPGVGCDGNEGREASKGHIPLGASLFAEGLGLTTFHQASQLHL